MSNLLNPPERALRTWCQRDSYYSCCIKNTLYEVVDEPQKLYLSLSVAESVQSKLFLMYRCSVSTMNFSS